MFRQILSRFHLKSKAAVGFRRRIDGYWRRANYEYSMWRFRRAEKEKGLQFALWMQRLEKSQPEVLIGANFVEFGGTRHHMQALEMYSNLRVRLVPDDCVLRTVKPYDLATRFRDEFMAYTPSNLLAVHSHVFPWFIEWCQHKQKSHAVSWIHTHHNWYYPEFGKDGIEPWQASLNEAFLLAIGQADVALSVSRWQQAFLLREFGLKTHYLPNGVNFELCRQGVANRAIKSFGVGNFLLYVGRNDPVKNPADFVRLAECLPQCQCVMVGQGLSSQVMEEEWTTPVPANLKIFGEVTHQRVQDAIAACSALVVTSKREGLPTLVLEAMAHGKSVVVPDEDGCVEAVDGGRFGFVYRHGNIGDLAEKTLAAVHDRDRAAIAPERVATEYDWKIILRKLDGIYRGDRSKFTVTRQS